MNRERLRGAVAGFGIAGIPGFVVCLVCWVWNPLFVDEPASIWLWSVAFPGLLGALLCWVKGCEVSGRWPVLLSAGTLTLMTGFSVPSGDKLHDTKLVILGVDGATWDVIDPMIKEGELPAFSSARAAGASGRMRAPEPIFSPLVWTTLATGLGAMEHGIRGFSMESTAIKAPRFWNIAESEGLSVGIYKWLVTWPPERLERGFMVPAWLAKSAETTPSTLSVVKELELSQRQRRQAVNSGRSLVFLVPDLIRAGVRWSTLREACWWRLRMKLGAVSPEELDAGLQQLRVSIDWDVFVAASLQEQPGVASFSLYATDALSHRFWRYHEPDRFETVSDEEVSRYGEVVRDAYRQADQLLAELMDIVGEDTRVLLVSDHGFQALVSEGHKRMLPRTEPVSRWFEARGLHPEVLRQGAKLRVLSTDIGLREHLEAFEEAHRLKGDEAIFRVEVIPGTEAALGLAVIAEHLDPAALLGSGQPLRTLLKPAEGFSGDHHPAGIVLALGPEVTPGSQIHIRAIDFTPIVLAALDIPQGEDMVGKVPAGLWPSAGVGPSWSGLRAKMSFVSTSASDDEMTTEALQALGYLD